MATIASDGWPNLANWAARQKPGGGIADIVNVLSETTPVLDDIPWKEGNLPTGDLVTQSANALPSATWRQLNTGVAKTKAETSQYIESCGILEDESAIDVRLAELNGDGPAYRMAEDKLKMEGIGQQFATAVWYESTSTNPERIHGLTPRYSATSGITAASYVSAGSNAGTNCHSVWLVTWDPELCTGIYPKGTRAGLEVRDMGERRVLDSNSNAYWAWVTNLVWRCGIEVRDYRYLVRHQWDPDDANYADSAKDLYLKMQEMMVTIFKLTPASRFYMNRTTYKKLQAQLGSNDANFLGWVNPAMGAGGMPIRTFMGVPIRVTDQLVAETAIS